MIHTWFPSALIQFCSSFLHAADPINSKADGRVGEKGEPTPTLFKFSIGLGHAYWWKTDSRDQDFQGKREQQDFFFVHPPFQMYAQWDNVRANSLLRHRIIQLGRKIQNRFPIQEFTRYQNPLCLCLASRASIKVFPQITLQITSKQQIKQQSYVLLFGSKPQGPQ